MRYSIFILTLFVTFSFGCKDNSVNTSVGSIGGRVVIVDFKGNALGDLSGAKIELEGTSMSSTTDSLGNWKFGDVPVGTYTIRCSKPGFGFSRLQGYQINGNIILRTNELFVLGAPPPFTPVLDTITASSVSVICKSHINNDSSGLYPIYSILLINKTQNINPLDSSNFVYAGSVAQVQMAIVIKTLHDAGFKSGQTYYARMFCVGGAYSTSAGAYVPSAYTDSYTSNDVYTSTGPGSNVMSFVMP